MSLGKILKRSGLNSLLMTTICLGVSLLNHMAPMFAFFLINLGRSPRTFKNTELKDSQCSSAMWNKFCWIVKRTMRCVLRFYQNRPVWTKNDKTHFQYWSSVMLQRIGSTMVKKRLQLYKTSTRCVKMLIRFWISNCSCTL